MSDCQDEKTLILVDTSATERSKQDTLLGKERVSSKVCFDLPSKPLNQDTGFWFKDHRVITSFHCGCSMSGTLHTYLVK